MTFLSTGRGISFMYIAKRNAATICDGVVSYAVVLSGGDHSVIGVVQIAQASVGVVQVRGSDDVFIRESCDRHLRFLILLLHIITSF